MNRMQRLAMSMTTHDGGTMKTKAMFAGTRVNAVALAGIVFGLVSGCSGAAFGPTGGQTDVHTSVGQIALLPTVEVDNLEQLMDRSAGTVFLRSVTMHAENARVVRADGSDAPLSDDGLLLLHYDPSANQEAWSTLWAPATGDFVELALSLAPTTVPADRLEAESRVRGYDVTALAGSTVLIEGVVGVPTTGSPGGVVALNASDQPGADPCTFRGVGCGGTVPDTAPAVGNLRARVNNGTVPDTAPAWSDTGSDQGSQKAQSAPGTLPGREYRRFTVIATGRLGLAAPLEASVAVHGGMVALHLDVNALFSEERLRDLQQAAQTVSPASSVTREVGAAEIQNALRFSKAQMHGEGVRPR